MNTSTELDALLDFMDELPTNPCGEGGCTSCDLAFHRSCDPILATGRVHVDFEAEEDTHLDIRNVFQTDEQEYQVLGGESG